MSITPGRLAWRETCFFPLAITPPSRGRGVANSTPAFHSKRASKRVKFGGARRDRTDDLMLAKHALYQLSYGPDGEVWSKAIKP